MNNLRLAILALSAAVLQAVPALAQLGIDAQRIPELPQEPRRNPSLGLDSSDNPTGGVLLHSGEMTLVRRDIPVRGVIWDFAIVRTYRSASTRTGPLGYGWDANVFRRLEELPGGDVVYHDGTGREDVFVDAGGGDYDSPRGFYCRLKKDAGGFRLRWPDGTRCLFALAGRLERVEGRAGNAHEYQYGGGGELSIILDEFGREYSFAYDGQGRLTSVTDFTGRQVVYQYDDRDDLVEVRSPVVVGTPNGNDFPLGKRERYRYDQTNRPALAHNLLEVVAPNEVEEGTAKPWYMNEYGHTRDTYDRVVRQTVGGTNASGSPAGGTLRFRYDPEPQNAPPGAVGRTRVVDRMGNRADYFHDADGHCVQVTDDPHGATPYVTQYEYNADGELTRLVRPLGNETLSLWDDTNPDRFQQGNLLATIELPDPARGGDQAQIVTSFTYDPLFNRVATETDPRGNDPSYVPQNGGATSPARYTTTHLYDWQEAAGAPQEATDWDITIPGGMLGLGDLNGDGRTDQAMGNEVRTVEPTVTLLAGSQQAQVEGDTSQEVVTHRVWDDFGHLVELEDPRGNVDTFQYYPENDPDGDGLDIISGRDATTGGYLWRSTEDALVGPNRQDGAPLTQIVESFQLDRRGNVLAHADGRGGEEIWKCNALDQVVEQENELGFKTFYAYDANDNVVRMETENWKPDASGTPVLVASYPLFVDTSIYDILDDIVSITVDAKRDADIPSSPQPESLVTEFEYDANQNQVVVRSPEATSGSNPESYEFLVYDERDLVVSSGRGGSSSEVSITTHEYDANGNCVSWTDAADNDAQPGGEIETYTYDGYDRILATDDRAGNQHVRTYDPADNVIREERRGPVDGSSVTLVVLESSDFLYDELGRRIQWDQDLFLPTGVSPTLPIGLTEGLLTPGDGKCSERFEFDSNSRLTFRVEDDLATYGFEYDGADRVIRKTVPLVDPSSNATDAVYEYDGNGNRVRTVETHTSPQGLAPPAQLVTLMVYDELDRLTRVTNPLGETRYTHYDSRDNVVAEFDARGPLIPDPLGLYTSGDINDRGNPTHYAYDGTSRRWLSVKALYEDGEVYFNYLGSVTRMTEYDANGNVVREVDENGNATTCQFDDLDRRTSRTSADGGTCTWQYDRDDNVTRMVDENGTVHTFQFDGLDRMVRHELALAGTNIQGTGLPMLVGTTLRTFEYDGLSRRTSSFDDNDPGDPSDDWTVTTLWDSLSRVVEQDQNGKLVGSSWVSDDRVQLFYPGAGRVVDFAYDPHDQLVGIGDPEFQIDRALMGTCGPPMAQAAFRLQPNPQLVLDVQNTLDMTKRLAGSTFLVNGNVVGQQNVQRDRNRQVRQLDVLLQQGPWFLNSQHQWTLSSIDQVLDWSVLRDDGQGPQLTERVVQYGGAQEIQVIEDGQQNVLDQRTHDSVYERTDGAYQYNGGNAPGTGIRTTDDKHVIQWDGLNRARTLRLAADPSIVIAEYDYDAYPAQGGRRVRKVVTNSGPLDGETRFYYDGLHVIEERDGADKTDQQFVFMGAYQPEVRFLDTNDDGNPEQLFFFGSDVNGNTTHLVDASGQVVEFYSYETHPGRILFFDGFLQPQAGSVTQNPLLFGRQAYDAEGLYCRAGGSRLLDLEEGVYLSRAPGGFWGNAQDDGNPFVHARNNPWNERDPLGDGSRAGCSGGVSLDDVWTRCFFPQSFEPGFALPGKREFRDLLIRWDRGKKGVDRKVRAKEQKPKDPPKVKVDIGGRSGEYDPKTQKLKWDNGEEMHVGRFRDATCRVVFAQTGTSFAQVPSGTVSMWWLNNLRGWAQDDARTRAALRCPANCPTLTFLRWTGDFGPKKFGSGRNTTWGHWVRGEFRCDP